jgi:hypothetical protein
MKFSEDEIRFLLKPHTVETAARVRDMSPAVDLRALGCPARLFEEILEDRAKKLGAKFTEFHNQGTRQDDLHDRIQSSKLF